MLSPSIRDTLYAGNGKDGNGWLSQRTCDVPGLPGGGVNYSHAGLIPRVLATPCTGRCRSSNLLRSVFQACAHNTWHEIFTQD